MNKKALSTPYLIWMAIFIIIPLFIVLYFAFTTSGGQFTFQNFADVAAYFPAFIESIWLGMVSTFICLLLGYPLGYIISKASPTKQRTTILLIMLPMWINFLLRTYAWMTLLEKNGIINNLLAAVGLPQLNMINSRGAVILGMVYNFLPFMVMPIYTALAKIDPRIIEAAEDLGSNQFQTFRKVILPISLPGIISGITMVFVPAVSTFIISKMLGGGDMLIGDVIESQFFGATYNPNLGAALALILMLLVLLCMAIMNQFDTDESEVLLP